jgi:hypothetical protein
VNGAILGMRRAEIERKFDEIVAFSEIERFLDTPVKRYSSGTLRACGWPSPSRRTRSRKSCWWTRCWRWGIGCFRRGDSNGGTEAGTEHADGS